MKTRLTIGLLLLAAGCACTQAQVKSKPNLSGTWIVDATRSEKTNNPLEDSETSVTIQHNDPEIKLVRTLAAFTLTSTYFSDGRGETYKDPASGHELKSKTKWDGDKLVTRYTGPAVWDRRRNQHGYNRRMETIEGRQDLNEKNHRPRSAQRPGQSKRRSSGAAITGIQKSLQSQEALTSCFSLKP